MAKYILFVAMISITILAIASCDLIPPQNTLQLYEAPDYTAIAGNNIQITFRLYNSGSYALQNCKVRWYVDNLPADGLIDFDEITGWAPALGVDLGVGEDAVITVDTTSGIFALGVEYFGVYAWGWDNPPDE